MEFYTLICTDDEKYSSVREKFTGERITAANVAVHAISNIIAIHIGFAAAICVPLVAILLAAVTKVGVEAWCQALSHLEKTTSPPENPDIQEIGIEEKKD